MGPQEALGSGGEVSQLKGSVALGSGPGLGGDTVLRQVSPAQEVAAALLAPGLSWTRPLPRTRTSTPKPHAQLLPVTGDARQPRKHKQEAVPRAIGGAGPRGHSWGAGPPLRFLCWPSRCS